MLARLVAGLVSTQNLYYIIISIILSVATITLGVHIYDSYELRIPGHWQRIWHSHLSNLTDQFDPVYNGSESSSSNDQIRVKALFIYPIKSCKPIEVKKAVLTRSGFAYDRSFCFASLVPDVDDKTISKWRFISQRTKPQMTQIDIQLWVPYVEDNLQDPLEEASGGLVVSFPNPDAPTFINRFRTLLGTGNISAIPLVRFFVPLFPTATEIKQHKIDVKDFVIHDRTARGLDLGNLPSISAALPKLHTFLKLPVNQPLTLFRCTSETATNTKDNLAPLEFIKQPAILGYADEQPLSINNLASDHALSSLLPPENQPLDALRFRSNIYLTGPPAYDEESWKRIRLSPSSSSSIPMTLSLVCRTGRCTMPNIDPHTGLITRADPPPGKSKGKVQPGTSLVAYRSDVDECSHALGYMGMHCVPEAAAFEEAEEKKMGLVVSVGDTVEVLERGEHRFAATAGLYDVGRWSF